MDTRTSPRDLDLAAVFAALPGATAVFAADPPHFTVLAASDALLAVAQRPRDGVVGRPLAEAFPNASPEDPQASGLRDLQAAIAAAVQTGAPQRVDRQRYDLQRPDGGWEARYWDAVNIPVRGPDGAVRYVLHQTAEVTAQVLAEAAAQAERRTQGILERTGEAYCVLDREFRVESAERQAFLLELGDALRPLAHGAEIQRAAARVLGEHLGANRAFYAEVDGEDWLVTSAYEQDVAPQALGRHPLAQFGEWIVDLFRAGERLVIRDLHADTRFDPSQRAAHAAYHIRGAVAVPLVKEEDLVAILVVHSAAPRDWSEQEIALVEETAERTWTAVERAHAELALRASEARYRTLFESIDEGFVIAEVLDDGEGRPVDALYLEGNPAASRLTGIPDYSRRRLSEVMPGAEPYWAEIYDRVARSGVAERLERYLSPIDRWYDFQVSRVADPAWKGALDGPRRVAVVFQDITTRKSTEHALRESEERLRRALSIPTVGVLFFRLDGSILDANAALERMVGYTLEELRALQDWSVLTPSEFLEVTAHVASELAEQGRTAPYEKQWRRKDGSLMWGLFSPTRLAGSGLESECVEFVIDITRAKAAEAALRESEGRFRMLADNMAQLAWTCDRLGSIGWYNQRWFDYTGRSFDEMVGWGWSKVLHPDHLGRVVAGIERSNETREPWTDTFLLRGKDGQYRWFLSRAIPIYGERGDIVRWFGTNTDVTELREANRAKDEFLAMLGHELRNPLAPIVSTLELMRADGGRKFSKEREMMLRQARHLAALLDDLLDVSRLARGKVHLDRSTIALDQLVKQAVEAVGPLLEQRRHTLSIDVAPGLLTSADEMRMVQVISNLLTNAAHYTPPGGHIQIKAQRDGRALVLRVRDDGVGIAPELLPQVFERFQQGPRTPDRPEGGLGVGLAIVRSLVELHGGTVTAASEGTGKGSEFSVRLRAARARRAPGARAEPDGAASALPRPRHRILVVDDNRDMADVLALLLGKSGNTVEKAYDASTALTMASSFQPAIAILDIGLPDMSGYELAKRLRKQKGLAGIKLIALTGYGGKADRQHSKGAGFVEHVSKPAELDDLLAILERINTPSAVEASLPQRPSGAPAKSPPARRVPRASAVDSGARHPKRRRR